jgi:hypothetical protein
MVMKKDTLIFLLALLVAIPVFPRMSAAEDFTIQRLFHIERNKNANIVVYDARVLPEGKLTKKDPVEVYWLKLAEDGERKKLKRIERKMAYGFKVRDQEDAQLRLDMKADIGRDIFVAAVQDTFRALIDIDGRRAVLNRIYIFAKEGGILPSVEYIEMFGVDLETGEERYEKYLP